MVQISFSPQPSASVKLNDDRRNSPQENTEHTPAKITRALQATIWSLKTVSAEIFLLARSLSSTIYFCLVMSSVKFLIDTHQSIWRKFFFFFISNKTFDQGSSSISCNICKPFHCVEFCPIRSRRVGLAFLITGLANSLSANSSLSKRNMFMTYDC